MKSRMPERARTDPWEPQGSNPLGPPGPELHAISPCGTRLVSGSGDGTIRLWTIDPPAEVAIYYAEAAII